jgi:hypothetical protein
LIVVEEECDRLVWLEPTRNRVPVVATGSVAHGRDERSVRMMAQAAPAASSPQDQDELSAVCTVCGAEVERSSPTGIAYCAEHLRGEEVPQHAPTSHEQFTAIVERIAAAFPGGCTVHVDPPG